MTSERRRPQALSQAQFLLSERKSLHNSWGIKAQQCSVRKGGWTWTSRSEEIGKFRFVSVNFQEESSSSPNSLKIVACCGCARWKFAATVGLSSARAF